MRAKFEQLSRAEKQRHIDRQWRWVYGLLIASGALSAIALIVQVVAQ